MIKDYFANYALYHSYQPFDDRNGGRYEVHNYVEKLQLLILDWIQIRVAYKSNKNVCRRRGFYVDTWRWAVQCGIS